MLLAARIAIVAPIMLKDQVDFKAHLKHLGMALEHRA
jgi:hypothetical protein